MMIQAACLNFITPLGLPINEAREQAALAGFHCRHSILFVDDEVMPYLLLIDRVSAPVRYRWQ
jgi:hypothetical protein